MSSPLRRIVLFFSWSLLAFSVVGCAGPIRGGWSIGLLLVSFFGLFSLLQTQTACEVSLPSGEKKSDGTLPDGGADKDGTWESCCKNGQVSSCFCPAGMACNYGWYTDCGKGTCTLNSACSGETLPEAKPEEATKEREGTWEPCCENGKISSCFCPAGAACNYGMFITCGNGMCADPGSSCPTEGKTETKAEVVPDTRPDTTKPEEPTKEDAGTWETCCQNGKLSSCFCPAGAACNYSWYTDCGKGTCVLRGDTCPKEPIPEEVTKEDAGTWQACCQNGTISSCFCPAGMACNYGWYTDCGKGTCIPDPRGVCPKEPVPEPVKEVVKEAAGTWESCCQNGTISSCFCPAGMACNYGWYTACGNGTCVFPGQTCPSPD